MRFATVIVVGATAIASAAPPGRVVRVERARATSRVVPVLCMMQNDSSGMCLGSSPRAGDMVVVVSDTKVVAEVRVKRVAPFKASCDAMWQITGELVRGDLTQAPRTRSIGVIDSSLDAHKATYIDEDSITPPADGGKGVGIDRDGDGVADVMFAQADCDPQSRGSSPRSSECIGVWTRDAKQLRRVSTFDLRTCYSAPSPPPPPPSP